MSNFTYYEKITSYVEGDMPVPDQQSFEAELEKNPELKVEYEAYMATLQVIDDIAYDKLREKIAAIGEKKEAKRFFIGRRIMGMAAGILILLLAGSVWYANQNYSDQALFADFYETPNIEPVRGGEQPGDPTTPGSQQADAVTTYNQAVSAFRDQDPASAIDLLTTISSQSAIFPNAQFLLGHAYLAASEPEQAVAAFRQLTDLQDVRYTESAEWQIILAFLQQSDDTAAERELSGILADPDHAYFAEAQSLSDKMKSVWRIME